jgi:glycosyltransferase involved in cell wall biosynthesis
MISCIVPVYNNEETILHVLHVLRSCKRIDEIIAVDDCSQDDSARLIGQVQEVKAFFNPRNLGKGGAVVQGIRHSRGEILLICDADLSRLQTHHIDRLIDEYKTGMYDMVIAGRETDRGWGYLMSLLSGERIFLRRNIEPYLEMIAGRGNGIEQIINFAHKDKKVKLILSIDIGHILKIHRTGIRGWLPAYVREAYQVFATELALRRISFTKRVRRWNKTIAS